MLRNLARTGGVVTLTGALLTGCLSVEDCGSALGLSAASASCAAGIEYDGRFYVAWSAKLPVAKGESLGDAAYPSCDDGNSCGGPDVTDRPTQVWAMRGVDPAQVVVGRSEGGTGLVVYGRLHVDPATYFRLVDGEWRVRHDPTPFD